MGSYLWRSLSTLRGEKRDISGKRGTRTSYPSHRPKLRGKEIKIGRRPSCTEHALIRREGVVHSYFNSIYSNYFNLFIEEHILYQLPLLRQQRYEKALSFYPWHQRKPHLPISCKHT